MPEYLSPGVYIQEIPSALKAIEGVSTSTAGFVGEAARGPVPAYLPTGAPAGLKPDDAPLLVTSFADYQRAFGPIPSDPTTGGYMGHAVRAFFDNGGKRAFVTRVVLAGAEGAKVTIGSGSVAHLVRPVRSGKPLVLFLDSLRGIEIDTTTPKKLTLHRADGTVIGTPAGPTAYDTAAGSVTLSGNAPEDIAPETSYVTIDGVSYSGTGGPTFFARNPGGWGESLKVLVVGRDRPPVKVTTAIGTTPTTLITVQNTASFYVGAVVSVDHGFVSGSDSLREVFTVTEILPGNTLRLSGSVSSVGVESSSTPGGFVQVNEIDIQIFDTATGTTETFRGLTWSQDADSSRQYDTVINTSSKLAWVDPGSIGAGDLDNQPVSTSDATTTNGFAEAFAGSVAGTGSIVPDQIIGDDLGPGHRTGIHALQDIEDIRIIAAPGITDAQVQNELITQCERMRYRFAVLDAKDEPGTPVVTDLLAQRNNYDSSFAAFYTPWVQIEAPGNTLLDLPPSGYVMGVYARVDNARGVWKAPANEPLNNVVGLKSYITTGEQDLLNPAGVDCIRRFEGRGIRIWGARTLSSDPDYKYVNVRRFMIFLEASLDRGTQWVVFEPNSPETWSRVVNSVSAFLNTQWRTGALLGRKPEDAYYVRCDETTMSADDILNGRLICDIGVAIVRPAEFVIFRIEQITNFGAKT